MQNLKFVSSLKFQVQQPETLNLKQKKQQNINAAKFKIIPKLSPQQIQLMKLIQLPTQAFEQRLLREMNENPALETGKRKRITRKTSSKTKIMMIMMMPNQSE
jgi:DNA-directed RNA polymerase specialized sigma54-like protein